MLSSTLTSASYEYASPNFAGQTVDVYGAAHDGAKNLGLVVIDSASTLPLFANAIEIVFYHTGDGAPDRDHLISQTDAQSVFASVNDFVGATYDSDVDLVDQNKIVERWLRRVRFDWRRYRRDLIGSSQWDIAYDGDVAFFEDRRTLTAGTGPASLTDRYVGSAQFCWNGETAKPMTVFANLVSAAISAAENQNDATLSLTWG